MTHHPGGTVDATQARPQVLLIDDNPDNQEIYRSILEHAGYAVLQAWDGEEGVRMARVHLPGLVLMDIGMPRMDGWDATRLIREQPETSRIPILALTAHVLPAERERGAAVYDAYLGKPITPREVLAEVERFLGPGRR